MKAKATFIWMIDVVLKPHWHRPHEAVFFKLPFGPLSSRTSITSSSSTASHFILLTRKQTIGFEIVMGLFPSTARGNNFTFPTPVQTRGISPLHLSS